MEREEEGGREREGDSSIQNQFILTVIWAFMDLHFCVLVCSLLDVLWFKKYNILGPSFFIVSLANQFQQTSDKIQCVR